MNEGVLASTFLVVFRETLEAGLIVGIILTLLYRMKAMRYAGHVGASILTALIASLGLAWALDMMTENLEGVWAKALEGGISILACGVLTYMIFWMDKQAKRIRPEIESKLESAVSNAELFAIVSLPFLAVIREGFETVLFLKAVALQNSGTVSAVGGLTGFGLAALISFAIFAWGKRVPLKPLFRGTGFFLIFVAAGLLAYGIHELHEINWIPPVIEHVWDINHILNEKQGVGSFLKALFGYNGNPSLVEISAYGIYLFLVWSFLVKSSAPETAAAK